MIIPISVNQYALICRPFTHNILTARKSTLIQIIALTVFVAVTGLYEFYPKEMTVFLYCMPFHFLCNDVHCSAVNYLICINSTSNP